MGSLFSQRGSKLREYPTRVSALLLADEETVTSLDTQTRPEACNLQSYRLHFEELGPGNHQSNPSFPHKVTVSTLLTVVFHGVPSTFIKPTLGPQAGWGVPNAGPGVHLLSSPVSYVYGMRHRKVVTHKRHHQ
jgi:hypothetical protein